MPAIRPVATGADLEAARALFEEYARALPFALDFQDFRAELDALPAEYAPPEGCILLAEAPGKADRRDASGGNAFAGCVALRPLAQGGNGGGGSDPPRQRLCEMKRLYVRPAYRGQRVGRALAEALLEAARRRGYDAMRLDTVASMTAANTLYRTLGFREIGPYRHNPLDNPVFFEKQLAS